jgi:eukaryotic-like serine/threonine-protein kinase
LTDSYEKGKPGAPRTIIGKPSVSQPPAATTPSPPGAGSMPPVQPGQVLAPGVIAPQVPTGDPYLGNTIADRYRLDRKLGEGGMGVVYLGHHVVLEKAVAVKILADDLARRPDLVQRFLQEAKAASRIHHENIVDITDFGQTQSGTVFFVMELLEGRDLATFIRKEVGAVSWPLAKPILVQICRALSAAHAKNIIHRDMKPENVYLVGREGSTDFVKVLDFGIAKITGLEESAGARLTRTGMIFGTPEYMSPEQAQGTHPDHRVDIYAVGVIMYEMLTGQVPFKADTFMGVLTKHMFETPVPPSQARPDLGISPELDAIVLKALSKDRNLRFQTMAEFGNVIASVSGGPPISFGLQSGAVAGLMASGESGKFVGGTVPLGQPLPVYAPTEVSPQLGRVATAAEGPTELGAGPLSTPMAVPKSRTGLWVALVVALLVLGAGGFFAFRVFFRSTPTGAPGPSGPTPAGPVAAGSGPVATGPAANVVPPPATQPAAPSTVEVALKSRPDGADVLRGAEKLGTTPARLSLARGPAELTLTLRKPGHEDKTVKLTPDRDRDLEVELAPVARKGARGKPAPPTKAQTKPKGEKIPDLKNPFDE